MFEFAKLPDNSTNIYNSLGKSGGQQVAAQLSFYLKPVLSVRVNFKLVLGSTLFIRELTL